MPPAPRAQRLAYRVRAAAYAHALLSALLLLWTGTVPGAVRFGFFGAYRLLHPLAPLLALHFAQPGPVQPVVRHALRPWVLLTAGLAATFDLTYLVVHAGLRTLGGRDASTWTSAAYLTTVALSALQVLVALALGLSAHRLSSTPAPTPTPPAPRTTPAPSESSSRDEYAEIFVAPDGSQRRIRMY